MRRSNRPGVLENVVDERYVEGVSFAPTGSPTETYANHVVRIPAERTSIETITRLTPRLISFISKAPGLSSLSGPLDKKPLRRQRAYLEMDSMFITYSTGGSPRFCNPFPLERACNEYD
jgi:hypothetical protein